MVSSLRGWSHGPMLVAFLWACSSSEDTGSTGVLAGDGGEARGGAAGQASGGAGAGGDSTSQGGSPAGGTAGASGASQGGVASQGGAGGAGGVSSSGGAAGTGALGGATGRGGSGPGCTSAASLLLLVDDSSSMTQDLGGVPRSQVVADGVASALGAWSGQLDVGALFFPTIDSIQCATFATCDSACVGAIGAPPHLALQPATDFLVAWDAHYQNMSGYIGSPLDVALQRADTVIAGGGMVGPLAVVVLTDGAPTCAGDPAGVTLAADWASAGYSTHVLAVVDAMPTGLDELAAAGDTALAVLTTTSAEVASAVTGVLSELAGSCP